MWYRDRVSEASNEPCDLIARSLIEDGRARVVVATATRTVREMAGRHRLVGIPAIALGRGALCGLLLATLTKDEEQVTLQVLGNGPMGGITVDARSSGRVRGFVKRPGAVDWSPQLAQSGRIAIGDAIGKQGLVGVIRDLGLAQNYSGQVEIRTGEIDEEVDAYLNASEQIDSILHCDVLVDGGGEVLAAAGLLIQTLPQVQGTALVEFLRDTLRGPAFSAVLRQALAKDKIEPDWIARAALAECAHDIKVLEERPVTFFCPCSHARARSTLGLLRPEDLEAMILDPNEAQVSCNFCGAEYRFSESDLEIIRRKHQDPGPTN